MTHGGARPRPRRALHDCPGCGLGHYCSTDLCATCRDHTDVAYHGGWYVQGSVLRPIYPERRTA